jgi:lipopolysaccharide export LptBFGC system permease protein LptF
MKTYLVLLVSIASVGLGQIPQVIAQQTAPTLSEQTLRDTERSRGASGSLYDQSGGGLNVMQLIHNANLRGNTTEQEFRNRQNENLDSAVDSFRKQRNSEIKIEFTPRP